MAEDDDGMDERMLLGMVESDSDDDVDNGQENEGE
jgi:hypothetical protein